MVLAESAELPPLPVAELLVVWEAGSWVLASVSAPQDPAAEGG